MPILTSTPLTSRDLVDIGDVMSGLSITDPTPTQISELQRLITSTSVRFANLCGRSFRPATSTDVFRQPKASSFLRLSNRPVISVTSVTDVSTVLGVDDYEVDYDRGFLYKLSGDARVGWYGTSVTVAYTSGYEQVPADVSDAIITVIAAKWAVTQSATGQSSILKSFSIEGVGREDYWTPSTSYSSSSSADVPADFAPVADVIRYYRGIVFA